LTLSSNNLGLPLADWRSFYGIVGSSAAALTGLAVVVIALAAASRPIRQLSGLRMFLTPTVIHFGSALGIAALLSMPGHTPMSVAACAGIGGLLGVIYSFATTFRMFRGRVNYTPLASDWIWNAVLPCLGYLAMLDSAAIVLSRPVVALYLIGGTALLLLFTGIHNIWDMAVWLTSERVARDRSATRPRQPD
jgi:hypothetical protein